VPSFLRLMIRVELLHLAGDVNDRYACLCHNRGEKNEWLYEHTKVDPFDRDEIQHSDGR
jgi:hypothetical protein